MRSSQTASRAARAAAPLLLAALAVPSAASAQATRTWVSGVGDDVNPCSRTAPCKTFAGAISKTAAGGEIDALDDGGFGAVTITKSITIDGGKHLAGVLASATNGVVVNGTGGAPVNSNIRVTLRNLSINGAGTTAGITGVRILGSVANVRIENSEIFGFTQAGIDVAPSVGTTRQVQIRRTSVHGNYSNSIANSAGLLVRPGGGVHAKVSVSGSSFDDNSNGVIAESSTGLSTVTIRDSTIDSNGNDSVTFPTATGIGIKASGSNAGVRFGSSTISGNLIGFQVSGGAGVQSFGNNEIFGNVAGSTPSATVPLG